MSVLLFGDLDAIVIHDARAENVYLPEATHDLLVQLGRTPPEEDE